MLIKQRKIIQICTGGIHSVALCALCSDGTVWERVVDDYGKDYKWSKVNTDEVTHEEAPGTEITADDYVKVSIQTAGSKVQVDYGKTITVHFENLINLARDVMYSTETLTVGSDVFCSTRNIKFYINSKEKGPAQGIYKYSLLAWKNQ